MLAVLAVLAAAKSGQELTGQVVDFLEQVELPCWLGRCEQTATACAERDEGCNQHLKLCTHEGAEHAGGHPDPKALIETCYQGVAFEHLAQPELDLFKCAHTNGCVHGSDQRMSFLQREALAASTPTAQGVDMRRFLYALERLEGERLQRIQVEALSEAGAKTKIANAAAQLQKLHEKALPLPSAAKDLETLDENLAQVQAELDAHELRSRNILTSTPLGIVLSALSDGPPPVEVAKLATSAAEGPNTEEAKGTTQARLEGNPAAPADVQRDAHDATEARRETQSATSATDVQRDTEEAKVATEARAPEGKPAPSSLLEVPGPAEDVDELPLAGTHETLAKFVRGLHGDTASLLKHAKKLHNEDLLPLEKIREDAFEQGYVAESGALGRPATRVEARAARSSFVEGANSTDRPGEAALKATMEKLAAFGKKVKTDFSAVSAELDPHHLREQE